MLRKIKKKEREAVHEIASWCFISLAAFRSDDSSGMRQSRSRENICEGLRSLAKDHIMHVAPVQLAVHHRSIDENCASHVAADQANVVELRSL